MISLFHVVKKTFLDFSEDNCPRMAAALSYYTMLSLGPLVMLAILLAGFVWERTEIEQAMGDELRRLIGDDGAQQVMTMAQQSDKQERGLLPTIISTGLLIFGATAIFAQLQAALNETWEVAPAPGKSGIKYFLMKRLLSLGMVLAIAFLLLVSLVLTTIVSSLGGMVGGWLPEGTSQWLLQGLNLLASGLVITLLFAAMFKFLPDARIEWRDVWFGALVTALMFLIGKFAIGAYLGSQNVESTYGAAGSLALVLIWVYYSSMIFFLGAEFTQAWARRTGKEIEPNANAVRVVEQKMVDGKPVESKSDRHAKAARA